VVRSAEADPEGFLQDISADGLVIRADEPAAVGGSGLGLSPYQLLSAALAACTSMTIRLYARRKGLALDHVAVDVTHDRIHAADCADCETKEGRIDRFRRVVRLSGALTEAERARLLEIADRCPVHRTLDGEALIETVAG
jgi:putative redox protein